MKLLSCGLHWGKHSPRQSAHHSERSRAVGFRSAPQVRSTEHQPPVNSTDQSRRACHSRHFSRSFAGKVQACVEPIIHPRNIRRTTKTLSRPSTMIRLASRKSVRAKFESATGTSRRENANHRLRIRSTQLPHSFRHENDQAHRAAANELRIHKSASTAAPVQRLVIAFELSPSATSNGV